MSFLHAIESGVAAVLRTIPGLQVLERDTDQIRGSKAAVVKAEIDREFIPGSRIFEVGLEVALRINRNESDADDSGEMLQSVLAAICNADRATLQGEGVLLHSWFVGGVSSQWQEDLSVYLIRVKTHATQVS